MSENPTSKEPGTEYMLEFDTKTPLEMGKNNTVTVMMGKNSHMPKLRITYNKRFSKSEKLRKKKNHQNKETYVDTKAEVKKRSSNK